MFERGERSVLWAKAFVQALVVWVGCCGLVYGEKEARDFRGSLNAKERAWLEAHPKVRVAFDQHFPPYSFVDDAGKTEGFAVDMFALIARRTGLKFVYSSHSWKELYRAAKQHQTDLVATMVARKERKRWFLFTKPYIHKSLVIMTRKDDGRIRGRQMLAGKQVAVVRGYQYVSSLATAFPSATIQRYDTMIEALNAVAVGKADAAITFMGAGHFVRLKYHLSNLKFAAIYDKSSSPERIAVRKDWPLMRGILDKALSSITAAERLALERKWLPVHQVKAPHRLRLTEAEKAWIKKHPVIRLGVDPEFHPFEFLGNDGKHKGLAAAYVKLLNERLGLNMEVVPHLSWQQAVEAAKKRQVDVLPCVGRTATRQRIFLYGPAYLEFQRVIITRTGMPFLRGLQDLRALRVVVQANSSHAGFLKRYPWLKARALPRLQDTILAVSQGKADALVGNVASSTYWIRRLNLTNLKVAAAASNKVHTLHFVVRKDWPMLLGILKKGFASISEEEKQAIARRWLVVSHDPKVDYGLVMRVVLIAALCLLLLLLWNMQIRRARRRLGEARDEAVSASESARAANAELLTAQKELEDLVQRRTEELSRSEKMFRQAQKMEMVGTLVSGVAHDFNNILTGMLGTIEFARVHKNDPVKLEKQLSLANKLGFRGARMIRHLLNFARGNAGVEKSRIVVEDFLEELFMIVGTLVPSRVKVELELQAKGAGIEGDVALLEQVILNLVNNAKDAVASNSSARIVLRLTCETPSDAFRQAHPELGPAKHIVRIDVQDNGVGIEAEVLEKIFAPFFSTKPPDEGTGLGLSMAIGAIREHDGTIEVQSTPGEGTTFSVFLPMVEEEASEKVSPEIVRGEGQLVLLADDNPTIVRVYKQLLEKLGYEVLAAQDGLEALSLFEEAKEPVELAILDISMPGLDGVSAAREMQKSDPRLRVIFMTAYEIPSELQELSERELVLPKPCPLSRLSRGVKQLVEQMSVSD